MYGLLEQLLWVGATLIERYRDARTDDDLIDLAKRADHDAFQVLVERHQSWLIHYLEHLLSNRADAEELAQQAFLKAYVSLRGFRGEAGFRTWVRSIATRLAFDLFRYRKVRHHDDHSDFDDLDHPAISIPQDDRDTLDAIRATLAELSFIYCEILTMRYLEQMELDEISATLKLGGSATRMRLKRAREAFQVAYARVSDSP